ncbi:hypothetical protein W02_27890 [Nitrospira sp. KM1]|nr:hypothetical protein W02_27890 [Nitrospira sp. KM1]
MIEYLATVFLTDATATGTASSTGYPYTPVLTLGNAIVLSWLQPQFQWQNDNRTPEGQAHLASLHTRLVQPCG